MFTLHLSFPYFGHCSKVLQPFCNNEVEGQENYKETNPVPGHSGTAETNFEPLTSRLFDT